MTDYKPRRIDTIIHESQLIGGSLCNGCMCLEVIKKRHKMADDERYYCRHRKGYFNPKEITECGHVVKRSGNDER